MLEIRQATALSGDPLSHHPRPLLLHPAFVALFSVLAPGDKFRAKFPPADVGNERELELGEIGSQLMCE